MTKAVSVEILSLERLPVAEILKVTSNKELDMSHVTSTSLHCTSCVISKTWPDSGLKSQIFHTALVFHTPNEGDPIRILAQCLA